MKKLLKAIPLPICGVMLGFAALGNLLQGLFTNVLGSAALGDGLRWVCGAVALVLWVLVALKLIVLTKPVMDTLNSDPIAASVFATFPMTTMLLAGYAKPFLGGGAKVIWMIGVLMHVCLIVWFTLKYLLKLKLPQVFATWFIVYCGLAVAAITAPAFAAESLGAVTFWFGFASFFVLFCIITMRYAKVPVKEPATPLFCIYTAPMALCLAGYIQSVAPKSVNMVRFMLLVSSCLYLVVLTRLPKLLKLKFYPSFAAFTFPFVITAIAALQSMACLKKLEAPLPWLKYVVIVETIIAAVLCVYTLIGYCKAISKAKNA